MIEMNRVRFKDDTEALEKLKDLGIISKTKTIDALSKVIYKKIDSNDNIQSCYCNVIGFNWKDTPEKSINKIYENLTIEVDGRIFDINIDYLKDMQKKSWGTKELGEI
ncbi:MAG: hypothetical protein IJ086_05565 [Clostridium sp.]|nr:hypothetical protein [Clostridium sp.]